MSETVVNAGKLSPRSSLDPWFTCWTTSNRSYLALHVYSFWHWSSPWTASLAWLASKYHLSMHSCLLSFTFTALYSVSATYLIHLSLWLSSNFLLGGPIKSNSLRCLRILPFLSVLWWSGSASLVEQFICPWTVRQSFDVIHTNPIFSSASMLSLFSLCFLQSDLRAAWSHFTPNGCVSSFPEPVARCVRGRIWFVQMSWGCKSSCAELMAPQICDEWV